MQKTDLLKNLKISHDGNLPYDEKREHPNKDIP